MDESPFVQLLFVSPPSAGGAGGIHHAQARHLRRTGYTAATAAAPNLRRVLVLR